MRIGNKSLLHDILSEEDNATLHLPQNTNVVDSESLLHRMKYKETSSISLICNQYIAFVQKRYDGNCTMVFDVYSDVNSTNLAEHKGGVLTKISVDIKFNECTTITIRQEHFLAN